MGIISWTRPVTHPVLHAFQIYDQRAVMVGTETAVAVITDARDVVDYETRFEIYAGLSDYDDDAQRVLRRLADEYRALQPQQSRALVREHDTIVVEDLNVAGMVRNHRLARHIAGLGMAELRRQLDYKATDAGVRLVVADRWFPSSKTCSVCGAVRAKLTLAERMFHCESCGTWLDRDLNAARNLAALAAQASEPSCGRTENEPAMSQGRLREVATP